jgi:hypothetical protein
MALGEFFGAMDAVIGDLERMWKGFKEGRGGAREAGVRDLVSASGTGFGTAFVSGGIKKRKEADSIAGRGGGGRAELESECVGGEEVRAGLGDVWFEEGWSSRKRA